MRRTLAVLTDLGLVVLVGTLLAASLGLSARSRLFPLVVGLPTFALLAYLLAAELRRWLRARGPATEGRGHPAPTAAANLLSGREFLTVLGLLVWFVAASLLIGLFGGALLFVMAFYAVYDGIPWSRAAIVIAGLLLAVYGLQWFLGVELFRGVLLGGQLPAL